MDGVEQDVRRRAEPEQATVAALEAVYRRGYHRFLRVAEAIVRDPDAAADVVQDAFARAIRSRFAYRGAGSLEGWVWRTVVNTARNRLRDDRRRVALDGDPAGPPASNGHGGRELRALLATLPERQRLIVFLRYYADLDYRRIAEALEIEPGTVGAALNRAHATLRQALEEVPT